MEGGESEAESDSGVAASLSSAQTSEAEQRSEPPPAATADDKRRSARRKECVHTPTCFNNLIYMLI